MSETKELKTTNYLRQYQRLYYRNNKEACLEYQKKYRANPENKAKKAKWMKENSHKYWRTYMERHPERYKASQEKWKLENADKWNKYMKDYRNSAKGKKVMRCANWKQIGIVDEDLESVYDVYINETHCWICDKEFQDNRDRHLDHDHETGEIRYICCRDCNIQILANKQKKKCK